MLFYICSNRKVSNGRGRLDLMFKPYSVPVTAMVMLATRSSGKERRELLVAAAKLQLFNIRKVFIHGMVVTIKMWYGVSYA